MIGPVEFLVILAVVLLLIGPKQLPKLTKALKESKDSFNDEVKKSESEVVDGEGDE